MLTITLCLAGGTVTGEHIQCPFHGWEFDGEGKCKSIPYSSARIPEQAHLPNYEVLEINDTVLFWFVHSLGWVISMCSPLLVWLRFDAEGRDPMWYPPELPLVNAGWSFRGMTQHFVNSHIQVWRFDMSRYRCVQADGTPFMD
jgi:hypothetical protein